MTNTQTALPTDADYLIDQAAAEKEFNSEEFFKSFTAQTAQVGDVSIHYVIGGEGSPILLLHGWPGGWFAWHKVMPLLAATHTVIAVDMPGFGDSSTAPSYEKSAIAAHLHDLVKQLGYTKITLVGHDMGAPVAYAYAAAYREEVSHFIAIDTAIPGFNLATGQPDDVMVITAERNAWHIPLFMNVQMAEFLTAGKELPFLTGMFRGAFFNQAAISDRDIAEFHRGMTRPGNWTAGFQYYAAWFKDAQLNQQSAQNKLKIPVLALSGTASFLKDITSQSLQKVAEQVKIRVIENTGHFIADERPVTLANEILAFVGEN